MIPNIIHLSHRRDRLDLLKGELQNQNIFEYKMWDGIIDPTIPARGISQAHKQIVKYARKEKMSEILIVEDDIHFTAEGAFQFFINNKPPDYDIFLGSIYEGNIRKDNTVDDFSGLTIYIINERFYDIFISAPENVNLDRALYNKGKFVVCNPFIAIQHNGFSDNLKRFCNYEECLNGRTLYKVSS
ncbi:MAG: hypothetical protein JST50_06245 [Bacteroidetes bacterium]|jgi:hypothetical protein|nr:hypothetical protein [Bacteroidota bacterium]